MIIEQTINVPANHRLTIEVPQEVPAGRTILTFTPAPGGETVSIDELTRELRELCKDSTLTVDSFLEMRRRDSEIEVSKYRQMFHRDGDDD
jgi:hypothetical protein